VHRRSPSSSRRRSARRRTDSCYSRRLQRAEILLKGDASLSEIALAVGFASQSHFTEAFRRRTGRTPSRARRQTDATPPAPAPYLQA